ncbi:MAG TPA: nuclear transport factor 2 family protein [Candidatus Acidoferrales bacterium]|nr:nuclear transport factor 2 family protein [Candidatus Acidoferrales bacterium]
MALMGTLEDREEVRALHARYCLTIDTARYEEWVDCFTDDGVFESPRFGRHAGREGLRKFAALYRESLGGARVMHVVANPAFDLDANSGTGTASLLYYHCKEGRIQQTTVAYYTDTMRKTPAGWRFASRQVTILGSH